MTPEDLRIVRQKYPLSDTVARLSGQSINPKGKPAEILTGPVSGNVVGVSTDEAKLNKLERAYLSYLRALDFPWIGIQNVTFKLAHDCRLTVDFVVLDAEGKMAFVDVKGPHVWEDSIIKLRVAARLFPFWIFKIAKRNTFGLWEETIVKP